MTARCSGSLIAPLLGLSLLAAGCATTPWRPAGTWYGSAYDVGATSIYYGSTVTIRFENDGTWTAVEGQGPHRRELSGTSVVNGNQILLTESTGRYFLKLTRSGDHLYGQYHEGSSGHIGIELRRGN
ncbi:MAG TPA: hypothetical protein VFJ24_05630 [Gaiellales bacterium]|nr:hypothetical protein [Gaiellales bacterium]